MSGDLDSRHEKSEVFPALCPRKRNTLQDYSDMFISKTQHNNLGRTTMSGTLKGLQYSRATPASRLTIWLLVKRKMRWGFKASSSATRYAALASFEKSRVPRHAVATSSSAGVQFRI